MDYNYISFFYLWCNGGGEVGIVQPLKTMLDVLTTEDIFATVGYIKEAILLDVVVEYLSDRC